jgi:hypothetical protein
LKVGQVGKAGVAARVRELVAGQAMLEAVATPVLQAGETLREQYAVLHRRLLAIARGDEVCRRLMTVPGVGPVVAPTFKAGVDDPARFARSRAVGARFGLVPRKHQSGEVDRTGRISKVGDATVRTALFEAANVMLSRTVRASALKAWALRVAAGRGGKRAKVALARKLAVVLHRSTAPPSTGQRHELPPEEGGGGAGSRLRVRRGRRPRRGRRASRPVAGRPVTGTRDRAKPLAPPWPAWRRITRPGSARPLLLTGSCGGDRADHGQK